RNASRDPRARRWRTRPALVPVRRLRRRGGRALRVAVLCDHGETPPRSRSDSGGRQSRLDRSRRPVRRSWRAGGVSRAGARDRRDARARTALRTGRRRAGSSVRRLLVRDLRDPNRLPPALAVSGVPLAERPYRARRRESTSRLGQARHRPRTPPRRSRLTSLGKERGEKDVAADPVLGENGAHRGDDVILDRSRRTRVVSGAERLEEADVFVDDVEEILKCPVVETQRQSDLRGETPERLQEILVAGELE